MSGTISMSLLQCLPHMLHPTPSIWGARSQHAPGLKEVKSGLTEGQQGEEVSRTLEHTLAPPQHWVSVHLCQRTLLPPKQEGVLEEKKVWSISSRFLRHSILVTFTSSSRTKIFLKKKKTQKMCVTALL